MKYLQVLALVFMAWEIIRTLFLGPLYWKNVRSKWFKRNKSENVIESTLKSYPLLNWIGYIYLAFVILLVFSQWWWIGLSIIGLSVISALAMFPMIKNNEPFSGKVFLILFLDSAFTVFLLTYVINPLSLIGG